MSDRVEDGTGVWTSARTYKGAERRRISLPVGGIGTGTVGFGGRGQFRDWELENQPSKGLLSRLTFLALQVSGPRTPGRAWVLEGDLFDDELEGEQGSAAPLAGLPRFPECTFQTIYPLGRVSLSGPGYPVSVTVEAFNPLCPGDPETSGLPLAVLTVSVVSCSDEALDCNVMLSLEALTGHESRRRGEESRPVATPRSGHLVTGYSLTDAALSPEHEMYGTMAAGVVGEGGWAGPAWAPGKWEQGLSTVWNTFVDEGRLAADSSVADASVPSFYPGSTVAGTMGAGRRLEPGGRADVTFLMAWHFPNRRSWAFGTRGPAGVAGPHVVGNHYASRFSDAWDVVHAQAGELERLDTTTRRFVQAFWSSDLSEPVKEAALFNLSTLRSQTLFRTADGRAFGWEGCFDGEGCCLGSCTHVWNYDVAMPFLFGSLARKMREVEFAHATRQNGAMSFRVLLPLVDATGFDHVAADGQFGCVVKLYREWKLCGDDDWLRRLWPECRRSLEFAWSAGSWDADRDGLAEGPQHNTMDIEYFGPNPVVQTWYLAALAAASEMASAVGDAAFSATCQELLTVGRVSTEKALFNGAYYQQKVIPPADLAAIPERMRAGHMGAEDPASPEFQIGDGCIIDQLVGDTYARLGGLPAVLDSGNATTALHSIHELNYVADFGNWTNSMRTYVGRGERGHIVLAYPKGVPEHPMPYWSEVWSGLEYVYAVGLVQAGQSDLAEDVVRAVRERHSGRRRNPFDEPECGHHYARALSSWGLVVALTGFAYDARSATVTFSSGPGARWFWSNGTAWGVFEQGTADEGTRSVRLEVLGGQIEVRSVVVGGVAYRPEVPGPLSIGSYDCRQGN